jgi:hypothetical protein
MAKKKVDGTNPFAPRTEEEKEFMKIIWKVFEEKWKRTKDQNLRQAL